MLQKEVLRDDMDRPLESDVEFSRFVGAACGPAYLESKIQADSLCRCRRTSTQCDCHCGEFGISKVY